MKAILEFDLPEDKNDFHIASHAMDWALTVFDIDQLLRTKLKYGHTFKSIDEALEFIREELYTILANHDINTDDIE